MNLFEQELQILQNEKEWLKLLAAEIEKIDHQKDFNKCYVSNECQNSSINAHAISRAALEIISDDHKKIIASPNYPFVHPISHYKAKILDYRSDKYFSVGNFSCSEHDKIFANIDNRNIDLSNSENLFLIIYRSTLRSMQLALRNGYRFSMAVLDGKKNWMSKASDDEIKKIEKTGQELSFASIWTFASYVKISEMMRNREFDKIDYRVLILKTSPTVASIGMFQSSEPESDNKPCWVISLPQTGMQVIITATFKSKNGDCDKLNFGMPKGVTIWEYVDSGYLRVLSEKIFSTALDLAISPQKYEKFSNYEKQRIEVYLKTRIRYPILNVPEFFDLPILFDKIPYS